MACRLFGVRLLPEQILAYCQLDHKEQNAANLNQDKMFLKMLFAECQTLSLGLNVIQGK